MAERRKTSSRLSQAQHKADQLEREEKARSLLDKPDAADEPSPPRHWVFLTVILGGGMLLNIALIALLGASTGG